jgi:hypothetical protein
MKKVKTNNYSINERRTTNDSVMELNWTIRLPWNRNDKKYRNDLTKITWKGVERLKRAIGYFTRRSRTISLGGYELFTG